MISRIALCAALAAGPASADIVVDLPIVGALVEAFVDAPVTVLAEGQADPHGMNLRPSQARALQDADLIVHLGSGFNPAIERAIAEAGVPAVSLAELGGFELGEVDEDGDHADHDDHAEGEAHDGHAAAEDDDDHAEHDDHAHDHAHAGGDPHVWLDYTHLDEWMTGIPDAATQAGLTPREGESDVTAEAIGQQLRADLPSPVPGALITHDIWSRLTDLLGIEPFPVISDSHAAAPGARHLAELREQIEAGEVQCVLAAPSDPMAQAERLAEEYGLTIVMADPEGDPALNGLARYQSVFEGFAAALTECQANAT